MLGLLVVVVIAVMGIIFLGPHYKAKKIRKGKNNPKHQL